MEQPNGQRIIKKRTEKRHKQILELHKKGFSVRQIMRKLGFTSPASVTYYLRKKVDTKK